MIKARLWNEETQQWDEYFRLDGYKQLPKVDNRFDESFSTASFCAYTNDIPGIKPIEVWRKCELLLDSESFVGLVSNYTDDTVVMGQSLRGNRLATIELVELLAVTQYMPMSNLCFTNEIKSEIDAEGVITTTVATKKASEYIRRINNQIYNNTFGAPVAFEMQARPNAWWLNITMPEMSFTECTLFDVLTDIGEAVGGFPYLTLIAGGKYYIDFRQWDSKNTAHYESDKNTRITRLATIENQGYIVDSTVDNIVSVSPNGDNATTFPAIQDFKGIVSTEYETSISAGEAFFEVDRPIQQLLKVELRSPEMNTNFSKPEVTYVDVTAMFVEHEYWKTLREGTAISSWNSVLYERRNTRGYYTYGEKKIENLKGIEASLYYYYAKKIGGNPIVPTAFYLLTYNYRITYIPISTARILAFRDGNCKPIGQFYNQGNNVVSAAAFGNSIQGMASRIHGKQTQIEKRIKRGENVYHIGEWLNGEVITKAMHEYSATEISSLYITSPNFNRRNQYIKIPHAQRQWAIPSGSKVNDRNLLYAEEIQCSIGAALEESNGKLTSGALSQFLINYDTAQDKPNLAYIAWKSLNEIDGDTDLKNSNNYALATVTAVPIGRAISFHWEAMNNNSMGERTYTTGVGDTLDTVRHQMFVQYDARAVYLNWKLSNQIPSTYDFDNAYTDSDRVFEGHSRNKTFSYTFPLSNKKQWTLATYLANFNNFFIQKDLSERILFNYMLNFVGKNNTIAYENASALNSLCNSNAVTGFKVWLSASEKYGFWDKIGKGTEFAATLAVKDVINGNGHMQFAFDFNGDYASIGITDNNNNLLFASNNAGHGGMVDVYLSNRKIEWKKI